MFVLKNPRVASFFGPANSGSYNYTKAPGTSRVVNGYDVSNFQAIVRIINETVPRSNVVRSVLVGPAAVINSAQPLAGNEGAMGLNLLCDDDCDSAT